MATLQKISVDNLNSNVDRQLKQQGLRFWYVGNTTCSNVLAAEENDQQLYIQELLKMSGQ